MGAFMELCFSFFILTHMGIHNACFPFFIKQTFPLLSTLLSSMWSCDYILSNRFQPKMFTTIHIANLVVRLSHWIWPDTYGGQIPLLSHQYTCAWDTFVNVMYSLQQQSAHVWPQTFMMTWCDFSIQQPLS